jgi:small subunit ribosomal protein S20
MPHHKSAEKRVRTNERDRKRNVTVKKEVRTVTRKLREDAASAKAPELLREAHSVLDNAARKGVIHRKTVDRRKSRLAKLVNRKTAAQQAAPPAKP